MIKKSLERLPFCYLSLLRFKRRKHWSVAWVATPEHDLVIEGFPRSANSFAFHAFAEANGSELRIGTHTHSPAQVVQAARWKIPTMVLVRDPVGAVTGLISFDRQLRRQAGFEGVEAPSPYEIRRTVKRWEWFHSRIVPVRGRIFVANFQEVIQDFESVSKRFVQYSGRTWQHYDPQTVSEEKLLGASFHVGPNQEREAIKKIVGQSVAEFRAGGGFQNAEKLFESMGSD